VIANAPAEIVLAEKLVGPAARALAEAAGRGHEGVILKRAGSAYEPRRAKTWLKLKAVLEQEVAIVGWEQLVNVPTAVGALIVAISDGKKLHFAGKVGTGFSSATRRELYKKLAPTKIDKTAVLEAPRIRGAFWVEPKLVAQVRFTEWTSDGKLRHPSFLGLRDDKTPLECVRERPADPPEPAPVKKPPPKPAAAAVTLSSPDRLLYPADGVTKQMVADYYAAMAEPMLRALADRPLALEHWPKGGEEPSWFQQNIGKEAQPWMDLAETPTRTGRRAVVRHLVADRPETLTWLAQMAVLALHMWSSRRGSLESPDWVVFDFDPAEGRGIDQAIAPAQALRRLCEELKLPTAVKTSGKRGLHVLIPLARGAHTHEEVADWACGLADRLAPELDGVTTARAKNARRGRLYLDCLQNGYGKTIIAPYSLRGAAGAPVSCPLEWDEVTPKLDPAKLNLRTMPARVKKVGDLFERALVGGIKLPKLG
jgi:bifunctional non-homologous end joining protein LigD